MGATTLDIISQGQKCHKKPFPLVYHQSHKEKRRRAEQEAHQRAEAERRATEEQQRIASRRYIGRDWELER